MGAKAVNNLPALCQMTVPKIAIVMRKSYVQAAVALMLADFSPYPAAEGYFIQDIIDPRRTRDYLVRVLAIIRDSHGGGIGEHRLANWPTKF